MQFTIEPAFAAVQALAKDFEENRRHYLSPGYELYGLTENEIAIVEGKS